MTRTRAGRVWYLGVWMAALGMGALGLAACVHTARPALMQHYTLGTLPVASPVRGHPAAPANGKVLAMARISVPPWLTSNAMLYRLAYRGGDRLAAYAHSDWIGPPASLLEPIIQRSLAESNQWRAVLGPGNPGAADASLRIRLDDFSQTFSTPSESAGVIDATATLVDSHSGRVLGQRHFHVEVVAPSADAGGGADALATASRELAEMLQRWLLRHPGATR